SLALRVCVDRRVGELQQHISVAGLVQGAPAGEVLAPQLGDMLEDVGAAIFIRRGAVVADQPGPEGPHAERAQLVLRVAQTELPHRGDGEWIAPPGGAVHLHRVRWHAPARGSAKLYPFGSLSRHKCCYSNAKESLSLLCHTATLQLPH